MYARSITTQEKRIGSALLQHLIKVRNKSGAIKPAPNRLIKLKESIEGVPFALNTPSMSGVITLLNMLKGIAKLSKQLGGIQEVGNFQKVMKKIAPVANSTNPEAVAQAAQTLTLGELIEAVGNNTALSASLSAYHDDHGVIDAIADGTRVSYNATDGSGKELDYDGKSTDVGYDPSTTPTTANSA